MNHERIGQHRGVQLPGHALGSDGDLEHQRDVVEQGVVLATTTLDTLDSSAMASSVFAEPLSHVL